MRQLVWCALVMTACGPGLDSSIFAPGKNEPTKPETTTPVATPTGPTGSEEEAQAYAFESGAVWEATPGALEWLAARTESLQARPMGKEKKKK